MSEWETRKLKDLLDGMESVNPKDNPNSHFTYVDVSSVCRERCEIVETSLIKGSEAPSRARRLIRTGDVLFATIRPTLKRIAIVPSTLNEQVCSTGYFVLKPKEVLNNRFLFYYLFTEQFQEEMERRQKGASYPAVNNTDVTVQEIPLPPLTEQRRIVSILDEAFGAIAKAKENAEKNLANAKELFENYLSRVFAQKGEGWEERKFGELTILKRGHNPPKSEFIYSPKEGYIRFWQIRDGSSDKNAVYVPDSPKLHRVEEKDILMVAYRHVGRRFRGVSGAFNVALCCITNADESVLSTDYLFHLIPTSYVRGELLKRSERSLIPSMSVTHLAELVIPLPPIDEQHKIVAQLEEQHSAAESLYRIYEQKLAALNELKQSILQKAFTGQLTAKSAELELVP